MKKQRFWILAVLLIFAVMLNACAPAAATQAPQAPASTESQQPAEQPAAQPAAGEPVTLEYWVFSDYGQGEAGKLQETFIAEFEAANPGVKINMSPKNDDELSAGIVAAAASKTLPDIFMQGNDMGAKDVQLGALENIYDKWMAEPESFRSQFNPVMISEMTPVANTMYGMPYTGYSSFLFRNLTILKAAGIDPNEKVETWDQWMEQMKKIKEAGYQALPAFSDHYNDFVAMYAGVANDDEWGIDWAAKKTRLNPEKYAQMMQFLLDARQYGTEIGNRDQAADDLFMSNKLAYRVSGPWSNVTYAEAKANNNLDYDFVVMPGVSADNTAGHRGTELIGLPAGGENNDIAWKFVAYICAEPQMTRWATLLSRYNSNLTTLAKVDDLLLQVTTEGAKSALLTQPPDFSNAYPDGYAQAILDNMAAIESGQISPEDGAKELVDTLNKLIETAE
jgi:multiple sugar transport system substrate-binding protein